MCSCAAKSGEPFEYDGRTVRVTPSPVTPGGPVWRGAAGASPPPDGPVGTASTSCPAR